MFLMRFSSFFFGGRGFKVEEIFEMKRVEPIFSASFFLKLFYFILSYNDMDMFFYA